MSMFDQISPPSFERDLAQLINRYSKENASDTPDYILAKYVGRCMDAYAEAVKTRDQWFSFNPWGKKELAAASPDSAGEAK